ncbi:hypothetical protein GCM10023201_26800 [Actinomycetospora corticicola]|uniref:Uncharacterized protein n=1 Tax=Actinomycetospora corticicola TaxID=663602 RepID=A0A7Y9DXU5_9PSEU|nr:hypothetical protein [Actinomycetospora corticicola]NYD37187.1 hypothetical protein [Actinomycetospora corticicola]
MTIAPDTVSDRPGTRHHACLEAGGAHYLTGTPDGLRAADVDALRRGLDAAAARGPHSPVVVTAGLALTIAVAAGTDLSVPAVVVALFVTAVAALGARRLDRARRTVLATHEVPDTDRLVRHEQLVAVWDRLRCAATSWEPAVWEVAAHGGHAPVVRRCDGPRHLRADLPVPTFSGAHHEIAFLPDRVVLRDGRFHAVVGYGALEVDTEVRERAEGGRVGRLTVRAAGITSVFDLASVDAACATAAALRGMTDAHHRRAPEADRPARAAAVAATRARSVESARARLGADAQRSGAGPSTGVPGPRQASEDTGSSWASPTAAL